MDSLLDYVCSASHRKSKGSLARRLQQVRLAKDHICHISQATRSSRRLRQRRCVSRSSVSLRQRTPPVNGLFGFRFSLFKL